jgi:2-polyprenyl-3-methyl-5-hydroxy-6-metoxy-1,4-benzoquinol methylase
MNGHQNELARQERFAWERAAYYDTYGAILGLYQAKACLEHAVGESLLDMPCGDGLVTRLLAPRFSRVVGVDASKEHLAKARERLPAEIELHHSLIENFESAESFGTITMLNVLEHVENPVVALQKASRLLSKDGVMIVHVPNAEAVNRKIAVLMGTLTHCAELSPFDVNVAGHRRAYTMESLLDDVRAAGLRITATGGVFYKMLSTPQMDWLLKNGPWKEGGFGWGRVGEGVEAKDWLAEFCRACYEYGKERPEDCNIVFACATRA